MCIAALAVTLVAGMPVSSAHAADPPFIDPAADWLSTVNYFRSMAGQPPVVENSARSAAAANHSCYMLLNGISHGEIPGNPGYTPEGNDAGTHGNVAVSSAFNTTARSHIELWMTGPYHAIGVLRHRLQSVGFAKCDNASTSPWRSGATLDVLNGLPAAGGQTEPILFPGNGTTTSLSRFITESPNPLDACGWTGSAGLPVIAMMPEGVSSSPTATFSGPNGPIDVCVVSANNTAGVAQAILNADNSVVVIPRVVLQPGTYSVSVTTSARSVSWSFTVDPAAATGVQPVQNTTPITTGANALVPVSPARIVDSRVNVGGSRLVGTLLKRIQVTGRGGIPSDARAVSANFTITESAGSGYLTVWNCSADRPIVSTLNFAAGETVPNGATVPLDSTGGVCVYSSANADLIVDVNGYYSPSSAGRFSPVAPARLMDTRIALGAPGRLSAGTVQALQVTGVADVPAGASLVALNVTSISPSAAGFVTVYPCDTERPTVSSLNPMPGRVKPNLVISPVAADGTVCLYTLTDVDIVVDITGFVSPVAALKFTPAMPFRLSDTRDRDRPELNAGTNGEPVAQGQTLVIQVAGTRGVALDAKAVSANFTVIGAFGPGFITAWPCGPQPATSTVNYVTGDAIANGAQIPLSSSGQICVFASINVHVVIDINGWWS